MSKGRSLFLPLPLLLLPLSSQRQRSTGPGSKKREAVSQRHHRISLQVLPGWRRGPRWEVSDAMRKYAIRDDAGALSAPSPLASSKGEAKAMKPSKR